MVADTQIIDDLFWISNELITLDGVESTYEANFSNLSFSIIYGLEKPIF